MNKYFVFALALLLIGLSSCNKTKRNANRLMKEGDWKITSITVNGMAQENLPTWTIRDCDIYEDVCIAQWYSPENAVTDFAWQFRDKGSVFEISRQEGSTEDTPSSLAVAQQCYNLSGEYSVEEEKKDKMTFKSTETLGYPSEEVIIEIGQ